VGLRQTGLERQRLVKFLSRLVYSTLVEEGRSEMKMRERVGGALLNLESEFFNRRWRRALGTSRGRRKRLKLGQRGNEDQSEEPK
jgi:hypothetical protein